MNPANLQVVAFLKDGSTRTLQPQESGSLLSTRLTGDLATVDSAYFSFAPVVFTKTTQGWKKGPRSAFKNALTSLAISRSGRVQFNFSGDMKSIPGNNGELILKKVEQGYRIFFYIKGVPVKGVELACFTAGAKEAKELGATKGNGSIDIAGLKSGKHLFIGTYNKDVDKGPVDRQQISVTLTIILP